MGRKMGVRPSRTSTWVSQDLKILGLAPGKYLLHTLLGEGEGADEDKGEGLARDSMQRGSGNPVQPFH